MSTPRLNKEDISRLRSGEIKLGSGFVDAEDILSAEAGAEGTKERAEFDAKAMAWYYGEILKSRRKEIGLTQQQLAENLGRERTYISRIEKGETDMQLSTFLRIAHSLGLKIALL